MQPLLAAFVASDFVLYLDNGRAPRTLHDYGYPQKIGVCQHITANGTLSGLTAYFNGGASLGSSEFGIGRDRAGMLEWGDARIPVAEVHQYMPIARNAAYPNGVSPWAQGIIANPTAPLVAGMRPGEPNGAFDSIENVAVSGAWGVTDEQFNSNALLVAYLAEFHGYAITPETWLGHFEIDSVNRPDDPGWPGALYDELQACSNALRAGDLSLLHAVEYVQIQPATVEPDPVAAPVADVRDGVDVGMVRVYLEQIARMVNTGAPAVATISVIAGAHQLVGGDGTPLD